MSGAVAQGITVQVTEGVGWYLVTESTALAGVLVHQGNIQHRAVVAALDGQGNVMAGAVQRRHSNRFAQAVAITKGLDVSLSVVGIVLPVAIGIDGQGAVVAIDGGADKLRLPGIGIADGQGTGDAQQRAVVFCSGTGIGASDHCPVVGAVDGNREIVVGAIDRLDGDGVGQGVAIAQTLDGCLAVSGVVIPVALGVEGYRTIKTAVVTGTKLGLTGIRVVDLQDALGG